MGTSGGHKARQALAAACVLATALSPGGTARAATQSGTTKVVALRPPSIVKLRDLDFGTLLRPTTAGTVIISPTTDARTTTGGVIVAGGQAAVPR